MMCPQNAIRVFSTFPRAVSFDNAAPGQRVAIIGGGIGGACLGVALKQRGISFRIYEKDEDAGVRAQGYALTLQQGMRIMKWLGFDREDDLVANGAISGRHLSIAKDGSALGEYGPTPGKTQKQKHNVHIPREVLRRLCFSRLDLEKDVAWGYDIEDYSERREYPGRNIVGLKFSNGDRVECGLVVGADGIYSRVRALMHTKVKEDSLACVRSVMSPLRGRATDNLNFLRLQVVLGIAEEPGCDTQKQWLDGSTRCFSMPYNATHRMWQLSFPAEEQEALAMVSDKRALKAVALERCQGYPQELLDLIESTVPELLSGHPVYDRDPICSGLQGNHQDESNAAEFEDSTHVRFRSCVTLLGDSVHPMSPFKGQGANQCLLSVYDLARSLSGSVLAPRRLKRSRGIRYDGDDQEDNDAIRSVCNDDSSSVDQREYGQVLVSDALDQYEASMLDRSAAKMLKSREAAVLLHSPAAMHVANVNRASAAAGAKETH